jgi:hypothetical protein
MDRIRLEGELILGLSLTSWIRLAFYWVSKIEVVTLLVLKNFLSLFLRDMS